MAIITPALITALNTGYRREYQQAYDAQRALSYWMKIATRVTSSTASNTYGWLGDFPKMREWIGDRVVNDMKSHAYAISNKTYEATVGVERTAIEDDSYGVYGPLMATMGQEAAQFPDELISALVGSAHATLCYDGQNYFDADHPVYANPDGTGAAATVSNYDPGTGGPLWALLDTRRPLKPFIFQERTQPEFEAKNNPSTSDEVFMTDQFKYGIRYRCNAGLGFWQLGIGSRAALDYQAVRDARAEMRNFRADGNRPLGIAPNVLLIHSDLESQAEDIVERQLINAGESNPLYKKFEIVVADWLA